MSVIGGREFIDNLRDSWWCLVILAVAVALLLLPVLMYPSFSIIDDGYSAVLARTMSNLLSQGHIQKILSLEHDTGRFRPIYLFLEWFKYKVLGLNPLLHHLLNAIIFIATSFLVYGITKQISKKRWAGLLAGLVFIFFFPAVDNWVRLSTAEAETVFMYAAALWLLLRSCRALKAGRKHTANYLLAGMGSILLLAHFTKETTLVLIPISAAMLIFLVFEPWKSEYANCKIPFVVFFAANLLSGLAARFAAKLSVAGISEGSYTANYAFSSLRMSQVTSFYAQTILAGLGLLLVICLASFCLRMIRNTRVGNPLSSTDVWQIFFLVWALLSIAILIPWRDPVSRYLLPAMLGASIFIGIECVKILGLKVCSTLNKKRVECMPNVWLISLGAVVLAALLAIRWQKQNLPVSPRQLVTISYLHFGAVILPVILVGAILVAVYMRSPSDNIVNRFLVGGLKTAVATSLLAFIVIGGANAWNFAAIWAQGNYVNTRALDLLAEKTPKQGSVYVNLPDAKRSEPMMEIGLHLHYLRDRPDIRVQRLSRATPLTSHDYMTAVSYGLRLTKKAKAVLSGPSKVAVEERAFPIFDLGGLRLTSTRDPNAYAFNNAPVKWEMIRIKYDRQLDAIEKSQ